MSGTIIDLDIPPPKVSRRNSAIDVHFGEILAEPVHTHPAEPVGPPSEAPSHGSPMDVMEEELHDPMDDLEELLEGEMDRLAEAEEET